MRYHWMDEYLLKKPGVTKDLQSDWNWVRYKVGEKMFAAICLDDRDRPYYINLKLEPAEGEFFRQQYEDVIPGYYSNKLHWNSIKPDGALPDELLREMLDKSYRLVLDGLSRKKQLALLEAEGITAYCGLDCSTCEFREPCGCRGCIATRGMPFHCHKEPCAVAACAIKRGVSFCGECGEFPCQLLQDFSHDPEHGDNPKGWRIQRCRELKK